MERFKRRRGMIGYPDDVAQILKSCKLYFYIQLRAATGDVLEGEITFANLMDKCRTNRRLLLKVLNHLKKTKVRTEIPIISTTTKQMKLEITINV